MSRLPISPKRSLGQNFLVDRNLLGVIDRLAVLGESDVVLEVGPGYGVLTTHLAARVRHVHAVEIDAALAAVLISELGDVVNVDVLVGDALRTDLAALRPAATKLVSNLPYSIAAPLIVETLAGLPSVDSWCVMVQREVADRLFAVPGTKAYGAVSVLVQLCAVRTGFHAVPPSAFRPRPRVESALVALRRRAPVAANFATVKRVVEGAFAHRRKTLANSLELAGVAGRAETAAALDDLGHATAVRAEALSPNELRSLAERLT